MNLEKIDWSYLKSLRGLFTGDGAHLGRVYFSTDLELESYHKTLGARIGWKWQAMLAELSHRLVSFEISEWTDWGCGSGVASLSLLDAGVRPKKISLWDHSIQARRFASRLLKKSYPTVEVVELERAPTVASNLLLSHVLNELPESEKNSLLNLLKHSAQIFWVENGTRTTSRELSQVRDFLLATNKFEVLAPCSHNRSCGMLTGENERHWCHSFAKAPGFVHQTAEWREVASRLSIDLRSLPMSFLVIRQRVANRLSDQAGTSYFPESQSAMESIQSEKDSPAHRDVGTQDEQQDQGQLVGESGADASVEEQRVNERRVLTASSPGIDIEESVFRLIGEARYYKGYSKLLCCNGQRGVGEIILQKRQAPELLKALRKAKFEAPLLKLELENENVQAGVFI